jgi:radical SAM superfamily enzyme YgiQ (UPF0313 family)
MKVLLLNPSYSRKNILSDPILTRCAGVPYKAPYLWPPIGLAYIASALREFSDSDVRIIDAQVDKFDIRATRDFDLVVINTGTPTINHDIALSGRIRDLKGPKIVFTGVHSAYFHKELIKHCDFIIRGEPDVVLADLTRSLENGRNPGKVRGITWKDRNGRVNVNKPARPIENLDSLPFQAIDLLSEKYFDITSKKHPIAFMITSRYCPFNCTFCSAKFYSMNYRCRSAEHVFEEMKSLGERGFKDITFFDDSFTVKRKRVMEICDLIRKEKLDIAWRCLSRVDTVDRKMLENMRNSGCYQIHFGVESGDQRVLDLMKKGVKIDQARETFRLCDMLGIETIGSFVLGYPGEDMESLNKTVKFAHEIKPDFVSFNLFTPLPGSEIFETLPRRSWEMYDFVSTSFCDISSKEIFETTKRAYRDYYLNLGYFFRRIKKTGEPYRIIKQNLDFWKRRSGVLWLFIKNKS